MDVNPQTRIAETLLVPVTALVLHADNPNVMSESTFANLDSDILKEGFDEPIIIVPKDRQTYAVGHDEYVAGGGKFTVVSGNHRTKWARSRSVSSLPAVVKPDWTEQDMAVYLVRRNMVRGELDGGRMTALVEKHFRGIDKDVLGAQLGFPDPAKLRELIEKRSDPDGELSGDGEQPSKPRRSEVTESLAAMLAGILSKYGNTIEQDYLAFVWQTKVHFLVAMDERLKNAAGRLSVRLEQSGANVNDAFVDIFERAIDDFEGPVT